MPLCNNPSMVFSANRGEYSRPSYPTTHVSIERRFKNVANPRATKKTASSDNSLSTRPRMSYSRNIVLSNIGILISFQYQPTPHRHLFLCQKIQDPLFYQQQV